MCLRFASWRVTRMAASESSMLSSEWEMRRDSRDSACGDVKKRGQKRSMEVTLAIGGLCLYISSVLLCC